MAQMIAGGYPPPSSSPDRDGPAFSPWSGLPQMFVALALCLAARLATTIHHIEDADSLRFALSMADYDVTRLQPQFPGYPVFCFAAKSLYALLGSYAAAFSAVGGLGLFVLIHYALRLLKWRAAEPRGIVLILLFVFNPMLWLLGNRYMSDLGGAALALAAFYHLSRGTGHGARRHALAGFFLTGLLAGWRLSYAPFLLAPLAWSLLRGEKGNRGRAEKILAGAGGVLIWAVPLILVTGWNALIATARHQTGAHFLATGGTYTTESDWPLRAARLFGHLWTDGLGAWWPGRNSLTLLVAAGAILFLIRGIAPIRKNRGRRTGAPLRLLAWSCGAYALWIFLFQNVIHQTRHVLPLVPPLLMLIAAGITATVRAGTRGGPARVVLILVAALFLGSYGAIGTTLALQHKRPAAIAQAMAHLETLPDVDTGTTLVSAPWVQKYLSAQGMRLKFMPVETPRELEALRDLDPSLPLVTVGNYTDYIRRPVRERRAFFHNPYVNRLGSKVEVFRYGPVQ
jgi:hypothetical protein